MVVVVMVGEGILPSERRRVARQQLSETCSNCSTRGVNSSIVAPNVAGRLVWVNMWRKHIHASKHA